MLGVARGGRVIVLQEIINNDTGEVINVTRYHYLVYENGSVDYTQTLTNRGDLQYQYLCGLPFIDQSYVYGMELGISILIMMIWVWMIQKTLMYFRKKNLMSYKHFDNSINLNIERDNESFVLE